MKGKYFLKNFNQFFSTKKVIPNGTRVQKAEELNYTMGSATSTNTQEDNLSGNCARKSLGLFAQIFNRASRCGQDTDGHKIVGKPARTHSSG